MNATCTVAVIVAALVAIGCSRNDSNVDGAATDAWLGRWNGPEGTYLLLEGGNGRYDVTIANLDGPRVFQGTVAAGRIAFERDGVAETLHATNGADTGMKWLADKTNCLTVRTGEGYCRD
jgi:hypothetical protein